jgi:hypothetical protein
MRLRTALETAVAALDPAGQDPALHQMVVIGHSQGGLLTKLTAVEMGSKEWEPVLGSSLEDLIEEINLSEETKALLLRTFEVRPLPFVRRVIFLSTPHHGSYVSGNWLVHQFGHLVRLPSHLEQAAAEASASDPRLARNLKGMVGSVYSMTPGGPMIRALAPIPLAPDVTGHSIIAVRGQGPLEAETDGVVAYSSAHIDGMESELVVLSGHSVQSNPHAIAEVRRILLLHAEEACREREVCMKAATP